MSVAAPLQYAPVPEDHRRLSGMRITIGVGVGVLAVVAFFCVPMVSTTLKRMTARRYWEHQCLTDQAPPETIFYSNDPQDFANLKSTGDLTNWRPSSTDPFVIRPIPASQKLVNAQGITSIIAPTLFIHGRNVPSGPQRLVMVQFWKLQNDPYNRLHIFPYIHRLLFTRASTPGQSCGIEMCLNRNDVVRLYAGQADPNDASHFTIDYDLNGVRGTIDGKLTAADTVTLTPRSGKVVSLGRTSFWAPSGAPMPPAAQEISPLATTRPSR
jgi:hypothetical protein